MARAASKRKKRNPDDMEVAEIGALSGWAEPLSPFIQENSIQPLGQVDLA